MGLGLYMVAGIVGPILSKKRKVLSFS